VRNLSSSERAVGVKVNGAVSVDSVVSMKNKFLCKGNVKPQKLFSLTITRLISIKNLYFADLIWMP
jgi:hypothetical protein